MVKRIAQQIISQFGYHISRSKKLDLDRMPTWTHPLEAIYASHESDQIIMYANLDKCINYTGQAYGSTGWHPYVAALTEYENGQTTYDGSCLQAYYETWQPQNARDAFIFFSNAPHSFCKQPSFGFVSPWHNLSLEGRQASIQNNALSENQSNGNKALGIDHGFSLHGPVSHAKGQIEFERLTRTYESISEKGYIVNESKDLITGFSLVDCFSEEYRIIVVHGNHRLAALTKLGYASAPLKLIAPFTVRQTESNYWPNVKSEIWDVERAQQYFDSCFKAPLATREWAYKLGLNSY